MTSIKTTYAEGEPCTILEFNGNWTALTEDQAMKLAEDADLAFAIRRYMRVVLDQLKREFRDNPSEFSGTGGLDLNDGDLNDGECIGSIYFSAFVEHRRSNDGAGMPVTTYRIESFTINEMAVYGSIKTIGYEFSDREFERYIESSMEGLEA